MPSQAHALLVDIFRATPALALDLLRASGIEVTSQRLRLVDSTFPVTSPDYHVDLVVLCDDPGGSPSLVVLIEVQLDVDPGKTRSWPLYQAAARTRFKCDACVFVVAIEERVAEWARAPVALGPGGSVFRAVVVGPAAVPRAAGDATPEAALLSALAHGEVEPDTVIRAVASIAELEETRARAYFDLLRYHLGAALDRALETIMATSEHPYLSDFARKYYDDGLSKGKAEGMAQGVAQGVAQGMAQGEANGVRAALLKVIDAREIVLDQEERAGIDACADVATLDAWLVRAARATSAKEIFSS
jgi:hypothetical protein